MEIEEMIALPNNSSSLPTMPAKSSKKDTIIVSDHELTRKRDILASVAILNEDGLKSYLGEKISVSQIRNMKKEKLESYFTLYQEKAAQESTNEMMDSLMEMTVKGISFAVNIDNEE